MYNYSIGVLNFKIKICQTLKEAIHCRYFKEKNIWCGTLDNYKTFGRAGEGRIIEHPPALLN